MLKYLSICSGIEAATAAWHVLGWEPVAFAEIEPFPCAVLAAHYPTVPNLGDMTRFEEWPEDMLAEVDLLVGGTPCQAFSVAGARGSLTDARGNLTLLYARLLDRIDLARARAGRPPALCLWENVPGVLNTPDNALGCFLGLLAGENDPLTPPGGRWTDAGYVRGPGRAIAWRCLDAQYFGLAQRRDRVFVVASAGEVRVEQILFEREGVRRDTPPRRGQGEGVTGTLGARSQGGGGLGTDFELGGGLQAVTGALCTESGEATQQVAERGQLIPITMATGQAGAEIGIGIGTTLNCNHEAPIVAFSSKDHGADAGEISPTLRSMGHDGSHANGGGQVAVAFKASHYTRGKDGAPSEVAAPLSAEADRGDQDQLVIRFRSSGNCGAWETGDKMDALTTGTDQASHGVMTPNGGRDGMGVGAAHSGMSVRRITPRECERLQGFPDDYTLIDYRGKPAADGPRYKALGNSKAVPVVRWIGRRIAVVMGLPEK